MYWIKVAIKFILVALVARWMQSWDQNFVQWMAAITIVLLFWDLISNIIASFRKPQ